MTTTLPTAMKPITELTPDTTLSDTPAPGTAQEVLPGVFWLRMPLPFALDHINLWLLADGDGWTLVDTGYGSEETRRLWLQLFQEVFKERPLKRIIVTHYHPDHLGNAAWLTERGAQLYMTESEFLTAHAVYHRIAAWNNPGFAQLFRSHGLDRQRLQAVTSSGHSYRRGVPTIPASFQRLRDNDRLLIGGREWQVIVGYGHAPEHATLFCPELEALIAGDQVLERITTNVSVWPTEPEGDPLRLYLESLERFRPLPATTWVLPAHGRVFRTLHARLDALHAHHSDRLATLSDACTLPRSAADNLRVLFSRPLDTQQLFFALGETIAHLNYLWHRGSLLRDCGQDGVLRFCRTQA